MLAPSSVRWTDHALAKAEQLGIARADVLRFEGFNPQTVVSEEIDAGLRDVDPATGDVVGLEYWHASEALPAELLAMLPPPSVGVAA